MKKVAFALKTIALVVIFLFFAIWASSRWIVTYVANAQFEKDNSGMYLDIDSMSLNLFSPSVDISELTLTLPNENYVTFKNLELELEYFPLFFQEVVIEKFVVDDINIKFNQSNIADSTSSSENQTSSNDPSDVQMPEANNDPSVTYPETQETQSIPPWLLIVEQLHINDFKLDANVAGNQIKTSQTHFHLNNTQIDLGKNVLSTEIDVALSFVAQLANEQKQQNEIVQSDTSSNVNSNSATNDSIKQNVAQLTTSIEQFTFKTLVQADNILESPNLTINGFAIAIQALKAQIADIDASINTTQLNFSEFNANNLLVQPEIKLAPNFTVTIDNINAIHTPTESIIADINGISLNEVSVNGVITNNVPELTAAFENFNIQDILLLQYDAQFAQRYMEQQALQTAESAEEVTEPKNADTNTEVNTEANTATNNTDSNDEKSAESSNDNNADTAPETVTLFTLNDFNLNQFKTTLTESNTHVSLDAVMFDKVDVNALLHALPTFIAGNSETTPEETEEVNTASTEQTTETASEQSSKTDESETSEVSNETTLTYSVAEISHKQPITIHLLDKSVIPEFEQNIVIEKLHLTEVASNFLNMKATINASINGFSQLLIDVNPNTLAQKQATTEQEQPAKDTMLVDTKLTNFDLVSVSPYVKKAADMTIERGNVDVNSMINIDNEGWKGDIHLLLKSLGVTTVNTSADVSMEDESVDFIPLNMLLDKISDSKGHLNIDLPIEGKNGELSGVTTGIIKNIVEIITTEAAKSYLVETFVPYSKIVSIAQYAGNKMFEIKIEDLVYPINQFELPVPEQAVFDDYAKLIKEQETLVITVCPVSTWADLGIKPTTNDDDAKEEMKLTEQQLSQLYELAKKREVFFKEQLIAKKADMSRLVSCATKISNDTEQAGYLRFTTKG